MRKETRISRGRFLKVLGAAGVAGSTFSILSGCTVGTTPQSSSGGGSHENTLSLYNWSDYVNPKTTLPNFEEKYGVEVTQDFYSDNEALLAKLQAGGTGYDVIVPSDYMVSIMRKSDIIEKLDKAKIPNFANVGEDFKGLPYDPDNDYSIPYQWGTTGILYNKKELGEIDNSWDVMWDPEYRGEIAMLTDVRETMGAALKRLGYSLNTTDSDRLEEAKQLLLEQKPLLRGYFASFEVRPLVQNGDILLGHVYSGDGFLAIADNKDLDYAIPEEGGTRWTDNMAIPMGAEHVDNAYKFINYILSAKAGASLTNYTYYGSPNEAARPMIKKEILDDPRIFPPPGVFDQLEVIEDIGGATRQYERIFTEVKSA